MAPSAGTPYASAGEAAMTAIRVNPVISGSMMGSPRPASASHAALLRSPGRCVMSAACTAACRCVARAARLAIVSRARWPSFTLLRSAAATAGSTSGVALYSRATSAALLSVFQKQRTDSPASACRRPWTRTCTAETACASEPIAPASWTGAAATKGTNTAAAAGRWRGGGGGRRVASPQMSLR